MRDLKRSTTRHTFKLKLHSSKWLYHIEVIKREGATSSLATSSTFNFLISVYTLGILHLFIH